MSSSHRVVWDDRYSVGIKEIDDQHKQLFAIMNELLDGLEKHISEQHLAKITRELIAYKKQHFATEEKYFDLFHYEDKDAHIAKHWEFGQKLEALNALDPEFSVEYAYNLVEFLEEWFVEHIMRADQAYKACFHEHGLQ